jgi:hypothetical protein
MVLVDVYNRTMLLKLSPTTYCPLNLSLIKVFCANGRPIEVHHIPNGHIGRNVHHPESMFQRSRAAAVVEVVSDIGRRVVWRVWSRAAGNVGSAHVRQASWVVGLLPILGISIQLQALI